MNSIRKSGTKCNSWNYLFAKKNDNNYMPLIISSIWSLCNNDNTYLRHQASLLSWTAKKGLWGLTAENSGEKGCKTFIWNIVSKTPKTELSCYLDPDTCIKYSNVQNDAQINATREPGQEIFLRFCSKIGEFLPRQVPGGLWTSGIIFPILQASYFDLCRQISLCDWEGYYSARGGVKFPSKGEYTTDDTDFNSSQRNNS